MAFTTNQTPQSYGYIYGTYDHLNNKIYVGQSSKFDRRIKSYYGGGTKIYYVIKKHKLKLEKRIIGFCDTIDELDEAETECISFFNADNRRYGYNILSIGKRTLRVMRGENNSNYKAVDIDSFKIDFLNITLTAKSLYKKYGIGHKKYGRVARQLFDKLTIDHIKLQRQIYNNTGRKFSSESNLKKSQSLKGRFTPSGNANHKYIKINESDKQLIVKLYKEGISISKISKIVNINRILISRRLKKEWHNEISNLEVV